MGCSTETVADTIPFTLYSVCVLGFLCFNKSFGKGLTRSVFLRFSLTYEGGEVGAGQGWGQMVCRPKPPLPKTWPCGAEGLAGKEGHPRSV